MKKIMHEQNEKFHKEIAIVRGKKILDLKNTINEFKIQKRFSNALNYTKERTSILEDRTLKITRKSRKEKKRKSKETLWELQETTKKEKIFILWEFKKKRRKKVYLKQ